MKNKSIFIIIVLLWISSVYSQEARRNIVNSGFSYLGLKTGIGFFQNINLDLTDFTDQVIASSDQMVPTNIQAEYTYYFHPKVGIRFSSGYCFSIDGGKNLYETDGIDSAAVMYRGESTFSMSGFPADLAVIFRNAITDKKDVFLKMGIGFGYYAYNYKSEGELKKVQILTNDRLWIEQYRNPEITLSGFAQFFIVGMDVQFTKNLGATIEMSKVGMSNMKITKDLIEQEVYDREISNEIKYGYDEKSYQPQSGFDDVALTFGVFWRL